MNIPQVTVMIHEKRNHPHEYGHYDAEVRLVAYIEPDQSIIGAIEELRQLARDQVRAECDAWIERLAEDRRVDSLVMAIDRDLACLTRHTSRPLREAKSALRNIRELPEHMQGHWETLLREALRRAALRKLKAAPAWPTCPECGEDLDGAGLCPACEPEPVDSADIPEPDF
ncbi:MAG: hypothetical protein KKA73_00700 [Chloroflexi bacterium]|nr:hypothetical protein [Chloroflexota bacterium]MBU1746181.1 hypothetical protein [Chloroflexota bacterium]